MIDLQNNKKQDKRNKKRGTGSKLEPVSVFAGKIPLGTGVGGIGIVGGGVGGTVASAEILAVGTGMILNTQSTPLPPVLSSSSSSFPPSHYSPVNNGKTQQLPLSSNRGMYGKYNLIFSYILFLIYSPRVFISIARRQ